MNLSKFNLSSFSAHTVANAPVNAPTIPDITPLTFNPPLTAPGPQRQKTKSRAPTPSGLSSVSMTPNSTGLQPTKMLIKNEKEVYVRLAKGVITFILVVDVNLPDDMNLTTNGVITYANSNTAVSRFRHQGGKQERLQNRTSLKDDTRVFVDEIVARAASGEDIAQVDLRVPSSSNDLGNLAPPPVDASVVVVDDSVASLVIIDDKVQAIETNFLETNGLSSPLPQAPKFPFPIHRRGISNSHFDQICTLKLIQLMFSYNKHKLLPNQVNQFVIVEQVDQENEHLQMQSGTLLYVFQEWVKQGRSVNEYEFSLQSILDIGFHDGIYDYQWYCHVVKDQRGVDHTLILWAVTN